MIIDTNVLQRPLLVSRLILLILNAHLSLFGAYTNCKCGVNKKISK